MEQNYLSPDQWAKAVGDHVKQQAKQHTSGKITGEFSVGDNAKRKCIEICIKLETGTACFCIYDPPPAPPNPKAGPLSPEEWANTVGHSLAEQSKKSNSNKVTAEFTINQDARPDCEQICIYIVGPLPVCFLRC
jgi:hypothetical protein